MYILNSVQEYSEQRLLALKKTGKELVMDTFRFPSCCSCTITGRLDLLLGRFGTKLCKETMFFWVLRNCN
jgi:hypothetical protein